MIAELQKNANKWLIVGFIIWFAGNVFRSGNVGINYVSIGNLVFLVGMALFIYGCMLYSKAKGQNPSFGLLGLFSLLGLIVLALLPDKNKKALKK